MYLARIYVELRLVEDTHHHCLGADQWHGHISFHSATLPLMSSQITLSQAKETEAGVALATPQHLSHEYKLNLSAFLTQFQWEAWSLPSQLNLW